MGPGRLRGGQEGAERLKARQGSCWVTACTLHFSCTDSEVGANDQIRMKASPW